MRAKFPYKKRRKRAGIGNGSGHGTTACRGQKGQKSRSGASIRPGFEGGQNPLYRRLPKRGFNRNRFRSGRVVLNLNHLSRLGLVEITPQILLEKGIIKKSDVLIKVLGEGEVSKGLTVQAHGFSQSAKAKIEKAGGQAVTLEAAPARKDNAEPKAKK